MFTNETEWPLSGPQRAVLNVWRTARAEEPMPARRSFSPAAIGPWLSWVVWTEIPADAFDVRYLVVGEAVRDRLRMNPVGWRMSDIPHQGRGSTIWGQYQAVAERAAPAFAWIPYAGTDILVERVNHLLLPWGEGGRVTNILAICAFVSRPLDEVAIAGGGAG